MIDTWCGNEQFERNKAETRERRERETALKSNPLVFHNYFDVLAMARHGDKNAVIELQRRDAIGAKRNV